MSESKPDRDTKIFFRVSDEEREVIRREARKRDRSMDAFLREAAELYLDVPPGAESDLKLVARFLALAPPRRRKNVLDAIRRELQDAEQETKQKFGDASIEELEAALERKRRARELGDALDKLNEGG